MSTSMFARADRFERQLCLLANRAARRQWLLALLRTVSRLGDGSFWYALMLAMPLLLGRPGWFAAIHMLAAGGVGLALYKLLKTRLVRGRPFIGSIGVVCLTQPLDRYSFPSGHTLHAVTFTIIAVSYLPALVWVLAPFAALVALSRVVLGLHYPSDVLAGAALGAGLAALSNLAFL